MYFQFLQFLMPSIKTDIHGLGRKVPHKTRKHKKRPSPRQRRVWFCIQRHVQKPRHERRHRRSDENAAAGSTRPERPSVRSNRLQSGSGQVGQRSAAICLQSLLHGKTRIEYSDVFAASEYSALCGGLYQPFGFGA